MRYQRFRYRRHRFTSLVQINEALAECVRRINDRRHTRFGVTRRERFAIERSALKVLPASDFDNAEWKDARLHPDCYIAVDSAYYSAPHIHRGKLLKVKLTQSQVEIFLNGERLALHPRDRSRTARRIRIDSHFPDASVAYYEATPQHLLSQSRFVHADLHQLVADLLAADVYGNIRRIQGILRVASKEVHAAGRDVAIPRIISAIAEMRRLNKIRAPLFADLIQQQKHAPPPAEDRSIARRPGNPLLRYATNNPQTVLTPPEESLL